MAVKIGGGVNSEINVTPLVDVLLVLLIIFMVITPLMEREMPVRIPEKNTEEPEPGTPPPSNQYVVRLQRDGKIFLNRDEYSRPALLERLKQIYQGLKGGLVFVDADDEVMYRDVIGVIDLCREAGARTVATVLEALPTEGTAPQ